MENTKETQYWDSDSPFWASVILYGMAFMAGLINLLFISFPDTAILGIELTDIGKYTTLVALALFFIAFGLTLSTFKIISTVIVISLIVYAPYSLLPIFTALLFTAIAYFSIHHGLKKTT